MASTPTPAEERVIQLAVERIERLMNPYNRIVVTNGSPADRFEQTFTTFANDCLDNISEQVSDLKHNIEGDDEDTVRSEIASLKERIATLEKSAKKRKRVDGADR